jgi:aspartokinase
MKESEADIAQRTIREIDRNANTNVEKGFGLVTAIGSNVREKGMSASKFLFNKGIYVNAIARSATGRNLCVVVNREDVPTATQALHDFFYTHT